MITGKYIKKHMVQQFTWAKKELKNLATLKKLGGNPFNFINQM